MYHINGWLCCNFVEKELEIGITVMPDVETVFYQYIDRGITDLDEFSTYIECKYPKIKDLWISQNFFLHNTKGKLRAFYDKFRFRSLVIETEQAGMPLEDFATVVPPPDGLIAFRDGDRCPFNQLPGHNSDTFYGWLKKGCNFNPQSPWYKLCYMYALEPAMVVRSNEFIGESATYSIALPEPDLSLDLLLDPSSSNPLYQFMSNHSRAQYILANPNRLFTNELPNTETLIEVLDEKPELSDQMELADIPLNIDSDNANLLLYLIRKGRIDGNKYYKLLLDCRACNLSDIPQEIRSNFMPESPPPAPKQDSPYFTNYIYLSSDERDKLATLAEEGLEYFMVVNKNMTLDEMST